MYSRFTALFALCVAACVVFASCAETPVGPVDLPPAPTEPASIDALYDVLPNVGACSEGRLKPIERQKVLNYINALRRLHELEPVEYRAEFDIEVDKAALIIAANAALTHAPGPSMSCFTQEGFNGSATSNLAYRSGSTGSSEKFVEQWLVDEGVVSLGHRRWILDPFLRYVSFGRCDRTVGGQLNGAALKIIFSEQRDISTKSTEIVAYPYHDYPARLLPTGTALSLSVVASRTSKGANANVDYTSATVSMSEDGGGAIATSNVSFDNQGFGIANNIRWTATGLSAGKRYNVTVSNVGVSGTPRTYTYWFKLGS